MSQAHSGVAESSVKPSTNASQNLSVLIGAGADTSALAAYLDGLSSAARVIEVRALPRPLLAQLYARCEHAPPLTLDFLVPKSVPAGRPVHHAGINNLPLFRTFEKRFARTASGKIIGYNFQTMAPVTGPGFFVATQAGDELLIDYTQVPDQSEVPAEWPKVQPNDRGLSFFVYRNMHDFCRRVSADVLIGHATRLGKPMPQYFVLSRMS